MTMVILHENLKGKLPPQKKTWKLQRFCCFFRFGLLELLSSLVCYQLKLLTFWPGNIIHGLMKQIREPKCFVKRKALATTSYLLTKPNDGAAKAHLKLCWGQCRAIDGQCLLRGINAMLTLVTSCLLQQHKALKPVCKASNQFQAPLCSERSTLLTDNEAILQHWSEHFKGLFSDQYTVEELSQAKIPSVDVKLDLYDSPTYEEIQKVTTDEERKTANIFFYLLTLFHQRSAWLFWHFISSYTYFKALRVQERWKDFL